MIERVESTIHLIRGQRVMLDSDLAQIYAVSTKQLNQQLKRNRNRFPEDFAFQLTGAEFTSLRSQSVTSKQLLEPEAKPRLEIGFHVRERGARYRTKKRF
jgi:hypothetical protein